MALRFGKLIALEMAFLKKYENGLVAVLLFQISRQYQVGLGIKTCQACRAETLRQ